MRALSAEDGETKAGMNWKTPTFLAGFPSARHAGAGGELLPTFLLGYVPCTLKYMNMLGRCVRLYNTGSAIVGKINGLIIGFRGPLCKREFKSDTVCQNKGLWLGGHRSQ